MSWIITGTQKVNWDPSFIPTTIWLDASDASSITLSSGAVSQWSDKSGNGNHAIQSTSQNRPVVGTSWVAGKNAITFDSSNNQFLSLPSNCWQAQNTASYVVFKASIVGSDQHVLSTSTLTRWYCPQITSVFSFRVGSGNIQVAFDTNANLGEIVSSNQVTAYLNGNTIGTSSATSGNTSNNNIGSFNNGGGNFYNGQVAEILVCPSNSDRQKIEGYLAHKWGLTANLPNDHLYKTAVPVP